MQDFPLLTSPQHYDNVVVEFSLLSFFHRRQRRGFRSLFISKRLSFLRRIKMYRVVLSAAVVLLATNSAFAWGINTAYITQASPVVGTQIAVTTQKGAANYSNTLQVGFPGFQAAHTKQRGVGNFSHTEQWGSLQASSTTQRGDFNEAVTIQDGLLQLSIIDQKGTGNTAVVSQVGVGQIAIITQE